MQGVADRIDMRKSLTERQTMVDCQIRTFDVTDQKLIARLLAVPRELFVPENYRELAYSDVGLTDAPGPGSHEGRYLLPPFVLARLIQGGRVRSTDRVLDLAGGFGYSAALLSGLARSVTALESTAERCQAMHARLSDFGSHEVSVRHGDLAAGAPDAGPFDVILINGAVESGFEGLFDQLAENGRLLAILRSDRDPTGRAAKATCFEKHRGEIGSRFLFDAAAPTLQAFRRAPSFSF